MNKAQQVTDNWLNGIIDDSEWVEGLKAIGIHPERPETAKGKLRNGIPRIEAFGPQTNILPQWATDRILGK